MCEGNMSAFGIMGDIKISNILLSLNKKAYDQGNADIRP